MSRYTDSISVVDLDDLTEATYRSSGISSDQANFSFAIASKGTGILRFGEKVFFISTEDETELDQLKIIQDSTSIDAVSGITFSVDPTGTPKSGIAHVREDTNGRGYLALCNNNVDDTSVVTVSDERLRIPQPPNIHSFMTTDIIGTVGGVTVDIVMTPSDILGGIYTSFIDGSLTTPDADLLVAAIPNAYVGQTWFISIASPDTANDPYTSILAGAGCTFRGNVAVITPSQLFMLRLTNVTAATEAYDLIALTS